MKKLLIIPILFLITITLQAQLQRKITYYKNGSKYELLSYSDSQLSGKCMVWNDTGVCIGKVRYNQGKKDGKWYIWHDDGTPAYQFYYRDNQKVGVWKFYDDKGNLVGEKQYLPVYDRNTVISLGTFTLSDISITVTQRLNKNKPYVIGGEYSTYIADGETTHDTFEKFSKHSIMAVGGLVSHGWGISAKAGTYFGYENDINKTKYLKLDYGIEMFLAMSDDEMHVVPICGIGVTKSMGVQLKFGLNF